MKNYEKKVKQFDLPFYIYKKYEMEFLDEFFQWTIE